MNLPLMKPGSALDKLAHFRRQHGLSQRQFWARFGVDQSSASRYEAGGIPPVSVQLLLILYRDGVLTDALLDAALTRAIKIGDGGVISAVLHVAGKLANRSDPQQPERFA